MESVWSVSTLSIESVGSRREVVANSCTHRRRRRDKTVSSRRRRRCVLGFTGNIFDNQTSLRNSTKVHWSKEECLVQGPANRPFAFESNLESNLFNSNGY